MPRRGFAARSARSGRGLSGRLGSRVSRGGKLWGRVLGGVPFLASAFARLGRTGRGCVGRSGRREEGGAFDIKIELSRERERRGARVVGPQLEGKYSIGW